MESQPSVEELLSLAYRDDLTGLHNRRYLTRHLMGSVERDPEQHPYCLLFLDMDFFKEINDTHGHAAGDRVIIHVARILEDFEQGPAVPIRYAGDEFILFLPETTRESGLKTAWEIVEKMRAAGVPLEGKEPIRLTFSVGVASFPEDGAGWEEIMEKADQALYHSKQQGRNRASLAPEDGIYRGDDLSRIFPCPHLVGREEELEQARAHLTAWLNGKGDDKSCSVVLCSGPRGIGKTRFLEEFASRISGENVDSLILAGSEELREFPFGSLLKGLLDRFGPAEALREAARIELSQEEESLWSSLFERFLPAAESFEPEPAARLILRLLEALCREHPLAVLVDDAELLDDETLRLLKAARARQDPSLRAFVLMACSQPADRSGPGQDSLAVLSEIGAVPMQMKPLEEAAVARLVQAILPTLRADPSFYAGLHSRSQGNPQYIEEALKLLVQSGELAYQRSAWRWKGGDLAGLPDTLEALVAERLARLDPEVRNLLKKAAVMGSEIEPDLLGKIEATNEGHLLDLLDRARRLGVLKAVSRWKDDPVQFLSRTARTISYDQVPEEDRIAWHIDMARLVGSGSETPGLRQVVSALYHCQKAGLEEELAKLRRKLNVFPGLAQTRIPEKLLKKNRKSPAPAEDPPLTAESLSRIPGVFHLLRAAIQTLRLYPETSQAVSTASERLHKGIEALLSSAGSVHFSEADGILLLNGEPAPLKGKEQSSAAAFCALLTEAGLKDLWFQKGLSMAETRAFLNTWLAVSRNPLSPEVSWESFEDRRDIEHIRVNGRIYVALSDPSALAGGLTTEAAPAAQPGSQGLDRLLSALKTHIQSIQSTALDGPVRPEDLEHSLGLLKKLNEHLQELKAGSAGPGGLPDAPEFPEGSAGQDKLPGESLSRETLEDADVAACLSDIVSGDPVRESRGYRGLARAGSATVDSLYYFLGHSDDARAGRVCAHYVKSLAPDLGKRIRADLERNTPTGVKLRLLRYGSAVLAGKPWQESLLCVLRNEEGPVAREALNQLEAGFAAEASPLLLEILPLCPDRARQEICACLGRLADPRSVPELIRYLTKGDGRRNTGAARFQEEICLALSHFNSPEVFRQLARVLDSDSRWPWKKSTPPWLREAAVKALERMKPESVYPILKRHEKDRDPRIRYLVRKFLQNISSPGEPLEQEALGPETVTG